MLDLLLVLQLAIAVAFGLLAVRTAASWIRQPDRRHGYLALALGSMALLILATPALGGSGVAAQALTDLVLVLFLLSGYSLVMFRDSFVPISPNARRWCRRRCCARPGCSQPLWAW
jgi:4-amino-4-deoxy-L-arabinose transferase-like glycosyltransferase